MAKREWLMLAHKYEVAKHAIFGWFMSEKLDGQRFLWDGGVTRGVYADEVPWANVEKDKRFIERPIATGLWSRYGKVIHAPAWWLDEMPSCLLDGELYSGRGQVQALAKIVRKIDPNPVEWRKVKAAVFDSPPVSVVFADGKVESGVHYKKTFKGFMDWVNQKGQGWLEEMPTSAYVSYTTMIGVLRERLKTSEVAYMIEQEQLPFTTREAIARVEARLDEIQEAGGEGVVLRKQHSTWTPERSHNLLKYKPYEDDEATVTGYIWGRATEKGSKLRELMGALVVSYKDHSFELSGFSDAERVIVPTEANTIRTVEEEWRAHPGQPINVLLFTNPSFPLGSRVTFRYRELSDIGIPKEARYLRSEMT